MDEKTKTGIKLMTACMREIESGSAKWYNRGWQSHGWHVLNKLASRYQITSELYHDIVNGFLRWM